MTIENTPPVRRRERPIRGRSSASTAPLPRLVNPWKPLDLFEAEDVVRIIDAAHRVLEEVGLEIRSAGARAIYRRNGALVDDETQMVRLGREVVAAHCGKAPERFVLHARNPARDLHVGGNVVNFGPVNGTPHVTDIVGGRRYKHDRGFPQYPEGDARARRAALAGRR